MGMNRTRRKLHKTGAALAALATRIATTGVAGFLLAAARPAASHEAPAAPDTAVSRHAQVDKPAAKPARPTRAPADPFAAVLRGIIPLNSGFYLTSTPAKGLAFTLADVVLIGSIWNIYSDDHIPDRDVRPYFFLLGAVNAVDAVLSGLQARNDAVRIRATLTPSGEPMVGLAWNF